MVPEPRARGDVRLDRVTAPLFVHENERNSVEPKHHRSTFSRLHLLDDDFEVIPTPGHTSGACLPPGQRRLLLFGDTIYLSDGEWVAALLDSSDREAYPREPRPHPRAELRRARALGRQRRRRPLRADRQGRRAPPHRRDRRANGGLGRLAEQVAGVPGGPHALAGLAHGPLGLPDLLADPPPRARLALQVAGWPGTASTSRRRRFRRP